MITNAFKALWLLAALCCCATLAWVAAMGDAQGAPLKCDDERPEPGRYPYKAYGSRCEGMYRPKASGSVTPWSFSLGAVELPTQAGDQIVVKWGAAAKGDSELLVHSMVPAHDPVAYKLRATVTPSEAKYEWPPDIPRANNVTSLAVLSRSGPELTARAAVPVSSTKPTCYRIAFKSTRPLHNATIKVEDGKRNAVWQKGPSFLQQGVATFEVPLTSFASPGDYRAILVASGARSELPFRHE